MTLKVRTPAGYVGRMDVSGPLLTVPPPFAYCWEDEDLPQVEAIARAFDGTVERVPSPAEREAAKKV